MERWTSSSRLSKTHGRPATTRLHQSTKLSKAIKAMQQQPVDRSFTSAFQQGLDALLREYGHHGAYARGRAALQTRSAA